MKQQIDFLKKPLKIVLIGAGNVGWHLGYKLYEIGIPIAQVFSRTTSKAKSLATEIQANFTTTLNAILPNADLYILAVRDDAIEKIAQRLAPKTSSEHSLFVHTSGATPSTVFQAYFPHFGVFYPLQTFSKERPADFSNIPICIDAHDSNDLFLLKKLAQKISPKVYQINDEQRAILHVAAVFVNNFTNHLFYIGEQICKAEGLPFDLLKPLIGETVAKLKDHSAESMQTGPAIRGDAVTIKRHLDYLNQSTDYQEVYKILTESIRTLKK